MIARRALLSIYTAVSLRKEDGRAGLISASTAEMFIVPRGGLWRGVSPLLKLPIWGSQREVAYNTLQIFQVRSA